MTSQPSPTSTGTGARSGRPLSVTLAAVVLAAIGGLVALGGVLATTAALQEVNRNPADNPLGFGTGSALTTGIVLIVLGGTIIVTASFALRGASWARSLGILIGAVPLVAGIWSVLQGQQGLDATEWSLALAVYGALIAAGAFVVVSLVKEGDYFTS
jgi:hypothetical protein